MIANTAISTLLQDYCETCYYRQFPAFLTDCSMNQLHQTRTDILVYRYSQYKRSENALTLELQARSE
jgi:hypothetical protein